MTNGSASSAKGAAGVVVFCPMRIERSHVERALRHAGMGGVEVVQTGIGKEVVVRALDGLAGFGNEPSAQAEEPGILRLRGGLVPGRRTLPSRSGAASGGLGGLFVLAGACGGLANGADVPPIARVVDEHGHAWTPWGADAAGVTLAAVDRIVSTPAEKRALAVSTGAAIVDMESHAFAARCEELGVAWTVVRGVSDTPEETLPGEVMGWITPEGETRTGRAVWDMVRRPQLIGHIVGVVRRSNRVLPGVGRRVVEVVRAWEASGAGGKT